MSDQDQQDQQQQDDAAFAAGFNEVRNGADDFGQSPEPEQKEPEAAKEPEQAPEPGAEQPVFAGLTESQIKSLLERSARVDAIEDQLRKAHGKIGELNGTLQELKSHKGQPTQSAPAAPVDDEELAAVVRDYPEFAKLAEDRARRIVAEAMAGNTPQQGPSPDDLRAEVSRDVQMLLMDTLHDGWRDTVQSQDFSLWIATQPAEVQQRYATTESAKELAGILKSFTTTREATQDRSARNRQRLEAALTPSGTSAKTQHAPSAEDEFAAGFYSVRPKR